MVVHYNADGTINAEKTRPSPQVPKPEFRTLTGSEFVAVCVAALGWDRVDQLLGKSKAVETLILKAERIDRHKGNTPSAIAKLKTGANALTDPELAAIETAWRAA